MMPICSGELLNPITCYFIPAFVFIEFYQHWGLLRVIFIVLQWILNLHLQSHSHLLINWLLISMVLPFYIYFTIIC